MKVFLGGTCNGSKWRDQLTPLLNVEYHDPTVEVGAWDTEQFAIELQQRDQCDFFLYLLTPESAGQFSIAEIVKGSFTKPDRVIYAYVDDIGGKQFTEHHRRVLERLASMVKERDVVVFTDIPSVAMYLNGYNDATPSQQSLGE